MDIQQGPYDPTVGTTTTDTELPSAVTLADNMANPTVPQVGAHGLIWNGTTWDRMKGDSTDGLLVNLGSNNDVTVTNTGTFVVQLDGAALTSLQLIDDLVLAEDSAHSTGDTGTMALAVRNDILASLAGTDGDYAPLQVDSEGALYTVERSNDPFNQFGEDTAVVSVTETTIASYTVPAGKTANIEGFLVNGSATGRYKLKVDGVVKAVARTSAADRTVNPSFGNGVITATAGLVVIVTGFHEEVANQTMDANVFGYLT